MLYLAVLACLGACLSAPVDPKRSWEEYKLEYGKVYTEEEDLKRFEIFKKNSEEIDLHNSQYEKEYEQGLNQFSDLSDEEFKTLYLSGLTVPEGEWNVTEEETQALYDYGDAPNAINWVEKGYVTPVKNQGHCGSCYSFSATGALEGAWFKKTGKLLSFSEQQIVDCSASFFGNHGCGGGWYQYAWTHVKNKGGIEGESDYPYKARQLNCNFNKDKVRGTCNGYHNLKGESNLQQALASVGPVSVAIDAGRPGFRNYKSGVFYDWWCSTWRLNHAVLAVGYGTEDGKDYWLVKNSWSPRWGAGGYIKMARNRGNCCGIASKPSYPTV